MSVRFVWVLQLLKFKDSKRNSNKYCPVLLFTARGGLCGNVRVPTGPKKRKEKRNGATPIAALHVVESRN